MVHRPPRRFSRPASIVLLLLCALGGCAYLAREATIAYLKVDTALSTKDIRIEIQKPFLERYKDLVLISASFTVDKAMLNPVAHLFDGDLHVAGRAPQIGLPTVVEISNAASEKAAVDLVHAAEGTNRPLHVIGVWRVWPEHAGSTKEQQGKPLPPLESDNPNHVFEIHPVTKINELDVRDSFRPVSGFLPGDAHATFGNYQEVECTLEIKPRSISIITRKGIYNDVEFLLEITGDQQVEVPGGRFVIGSARDLKGNLLVERLRMVFVAGTPPELAVRSLKRGDRLHVYSMPRVDFAEISRRVKNSSTDPSLLKKTLPYEMIILGVYPK